MLFFKKKPQKPKTFDIYDPAVETIGNIYAKTAVYEEDNIDLSKVPDYYCMNTVYDGYEFNGEVIELIFSLCLLDDRDNLWGCISLQKPFTVEYSESMEGKKVDISKNLSSNRIIITQKFPFRITSMFYKEENGYYAYAKSLNGTDLYICMHLRFDDFLLMEAVICNLCNKQTIEPDKFLLYNMNSGYKKFGRLSFISDVKIGGYTFINNYKKMLILIAINDIKCLYITNVGINDKKKFVNKCLSSKAYMEPDKFNEVLNKFRTKEPIFTIDNLISSNYFKNFNKSTIEDITTTYFVIEDLTFFAHKISVGTDLKPEDFILHYIQMDLPVVEKMYEYLVAIIYQTTGVIISIE